jgi:UDP-4-amino-4,6-dideoxy-N-acetyl-beta-L-altrosamine transaminase
MIPYGRQDIDAADIAAVVAVLHSDFITQGPAVVQFEDALKAHCSVPHAFAMNSATSALHVAYMALDLGPGDILWTAPVTFVATANAALYCGADVVFVDIDPETYVMSLDRLEEMLIAAKRDNRLPKIVTPVHLSGQSCNMVRMATLAQTFGFKVVEDASHSIGGHFEGAPVGDCRHSDICVFSFHPVKIITTGEGGAATTRDDALATRIGLLRSHGITRDPGLMHNTPQGGWYYEQIALGYNYRMTDIQAALGTSQMTKLDGFIDARHRVLDIYHDKLSGLPLQLPRQAENQRSALHLYPVLTTTDSPLDRAALFAALRAADIGVNVHYMPVYRQPYYVGLGFAQDTCPNADHYYANAISIPMYATLTQADQDAVIATLHRLLG